MNMFMMNPACVYFNFGKHIFYGYKIEGGLLIKQHVLYKNLFVFHIIFSCEATLVTAHVRLYVCMSECMSE